MQRLLALMVLLFCGAASAEDAVPKWCSDGFDAPATLSNTEAGVILRIGDKTETFDFGGSIGSGISGYLLVGHDGKEKFLIAEITDTTIPNSPETIPIRMFRDRVFWPCGVKMSGGQKDNDREAKLEAAIGKIRNETWKIGQTLPQLRHAIALILQELKR